jgi:hypothetical protein
LATYVNIKNNTSVYIHEANKNNKLIIFVGKNNMDTYEHVKQPKPPLGVTSKHIYEFQRVQELCRALYERSIFETEVGNYELMIKWSDELNDRLYGLKGENK